MRLNKYIASAGICSRRKADELTLNGNVKINGIIEKTPGRDIGPNDVVEVNGRVVEPDTDYVYYMLHKPAGVLTSMGDDRGRDTVEYL